MQTLGYLPSPWLKALTLLATGSAIGLSSVIFFETKIAHAQTEIDFSSVIKVQDCIQSSIRDWSKAPSDLSELRAKCERQVLEQQQAVPIEQKVQSEENRVKLVQQGNYLMASEAFPDAELTFSRLVNRYANDPLLHCKLGDALFAQNKTAQAIAAYQQAIALNPDYVLAYNNLGVALVSQGELEQAVAQYEKALAIKPDYADALSNLGRLLWQQGKKTAAIASLEKAKNLLEDQGRIQEANQVDRLLQKLSTS